MSTNKKYVGEDAARALAAGIGAATPRTWDLTPDDLDSVTEEEQDGMVLMQFPTPARLKASLADIKTGDRLDASSVFGISACHLTVTTVLRDDASDGTFYHVFASMDSADDGIVYNFCIGNDNVAIVLLPLVEPDPQKLSASAGGSSWQYGAIPNWGDLGERPSDWRYYGTGSAAQPIEFKIGDTFRTPTLVPYGCPPSEASDDPADQPSANYAEGTIIGTGKVQNVPYLVVVGATRFGKKQGATDKDAETITAPGIFYVTRPSTNYWYVKFYPLLNKWKEINDVQKKVTELEHKKWNIGPEENATEQIEVWHRCTDGVVAYAYSLPTSVAENLNSMSKGDLLVLGGLPTEFINGKEIPIDEIDGDGIHAIANGRWYHIDVQINSRCIFVDFLNMDAPMLNCSIRRNKRHLRKHGHELTARPIRVLTGRLPKMGDEGNRNYYLYSLRGPLAEPHPSIRVNLWTRALKKWLKSTNVNGQTTFEIHGVGFERAYFTPGGDDTADTWNDLWMSDQGLTMEVTPEKITITKPAGKNCIDFVGLIAEMKVTKQFKVKKGHEFGCTPFIVRYDNRKGWMAFQQTSGFVLDKLSPITSKELYLYLMGEGDSKKIEVQFRTRALKDKSLDATDPCNSRYNFWSQTKRRGWVCRARRTRGQLYNGKSHDGNKVRSHAYRKVGASDWVYFSLRWGLRDADGNRKIESVRQLS